jgi:hypothetical protein
MREVLGLSRQGKPEVSALRGPKRFTETEKESQWY